MKRSRLYWAASIAMAAAAVLASVVPAHASTSGSNVYFNIRHSNGSWQGYQQMALPPGGCCLAISTATDSDDDTTHVDVITGSGLWDQARNPDGSWTGWKQPPQPPGTISPFTSVPFAEAGDNVGNIWFFVRTSSGVYYDYRADDGEWRERSMAAVGQSSSRARAARAAGMGSSA